MAKRLALLTDNPGLVTFFQNNPTYELVGSIAQKDQIVDRFRDFEREGRLPEIVLVTRGFDKNSSIPTKDVLINLMNTYKRQIRIVYIIGEIELDQKTVSDLKEMINAGIYDFAMSNTLGSDAILSLLENPHTYEEVSKILNISPEENEIYQNVVLISSLKPGTGKTFLAVNLAVALAKYGQDKRLADGTLRRPRIAIVDGDLLNLGVGSILKTDNYDKNMFTALKKISENVNYDGSYNMNDKQMAELRDFVRQCLFRYHKVDNLYCMVAPDIPLNELPNIAPVHYYFMIQMLVGAFDIIIVDSNSAFDHQTTGPLYEMAGSIYLLIDNDYNNIQNNLRYAKEIEKLGYKNKIHFVVNKDLTDELESMCLEDLAYNTQTLGDLLVEHRIPLVQYGTVKGLDYADKVLVTESIPEVQEARKSILELANDIWKIENSMIVEAQPVEEKTKGKSKKKKLLDKINR